MDSSLLNLVAYLYMTKWNDAEHGRDRFMIAYCTFLKLKQALVSPAYYRVLLSVSVSLGSCMNSPEQFSKGQRKEVPMLDDQRLHNALHLTEAVCDVNILACWKMCASNPLGCFDNTLLGFHSILRCTAVTAWCNTPSEDRLCSTPVDTQEDCSCHPGPSQSLWGSEGISGPFYRQLLCAVSAERDVGMHWCV